ncbi:hypothetical protein BJV78DRAFT_712637 [Lactifluus subvellereus]|nr:hypothetical protein BJV78DRAFT_712637 [Lactifluus subvellereus]
MMLFFIAPLLSCFTHSNASTRICVAVMSVTVACLTVCSILTTRRLDDDWEVLYYKHLLVLRRVGDRILASVKRFALSIVRPTLHRAAVLWRYTAPCRTTPTHSTQRLDHVRSLASW